MLRKLFIIALCLVATIFTTQAQTQTPPDNEIWYTTTDGKIADLEFGDEPVSENGEDFEIVSHTYENGRGVIRVNKPIKVFGSYAFYGCSSLTSITIPDSVTTIGYSAFSGCSSLIIITIPDSVTSIKSYAFSYCSSLASVYCKATTPPTGGDNMFRYDALWRTIYVPTESVDAYKSAEYWSDYASAIVGYNF